MRFLPLLVFIAATAVAPVAAAESARASGKTSLPPTIAIIIDDMGHNLEEGERLANMDQPLTLAFLPYRPYTVPLAQLAWRQHKEIMLHAPMANTRNYGLGPGGLTPEMDEQSMVTTLRRALQSIPHVQGVNNHMGSLLTRHPGAMAWLMQGIGRHGELFFIDSRTTLATVGEQVATEYGWDTITFLEQTCLKAGLPKNSYKDKNARIYRFTADVF